MAQTINTIDNRISEAATRHIRIRPQRGWIRVDFAELWAYRELMYFLTWRDIKIRYKQTALGASWAVLQPVLQMVVFSLFFGRLANISSEGYPYPIFNYAALLPWTYFQNSLSTASNSLVSNAHMITKVYFPRLLVPISAVLSGLVDFAIAFVVLLGLMVFYRESIAPTWGAFLLLPLFMLLALVTALGVSLWFSTLNVTYRDVRYVIPFVV
ncbi:MAG TPA: ABC transporter permease, partial [Anaerolineaceae bacterium]|nr:ABC transporter permease [Anaerolineaceae bacterium]